MPLRFVSLVSLVLVACSASSGQERPLTLEAIAGDELTPPAPTQLRWSPDGRTVTYLLERAEAPGRRDLWALDVNTHERRLLVSHEKLERLAPPLEKAVSDERERERLRRYAVATYQWAPDGDKLLFRAGGRLYLYDLETRKARRLAPAHDDAKYPAYSPDGRWVGFVSGHNVWAAPLSGEPARAVTTGGAADMLYGDLDWLYPEELGVRTGFHWAPDSERIAFLASDQSEVPVYPITSLGEVEPRFDLQRYPKAGEKNPRVRVGWTAISGGEIHWLDLDAEYIPRLEWIDDERLAVQLLDRSQRVLRLVEIELASGKRRTLAVQRARDWVNLADDLRFLDDGAGFLWTSERSGYRHLYRIGEDGAPRALTSGEWEVKSLVGVNEQRGVVFYTANRDNPLGAALYAVTLDGEDRGPQTSTRGTHKITMAPDAGAFIDNFSSLRDPGGIAIETPERRHLLYERPNLADYGLQAPELHELETQDGALVRIALYRPQGLSEGERAPLILYVYGGPRAPVIRDSWGDRRNRHLFHHYLSQQGYAVALVDDRASSRLGRRFETALSRAYGPTALRDHERAAAFLGERTFVDGDRVGIWGWSGGGFAACFALTHSKRFRAGVAVAPVTDWRLYDSIYTERYMGRPQDEPEAYERTSAVAAAEDLHGRLMLVHGTADDNVHIQNTWMMIDALIEAGKQYDLRIYPGKTHGIAGERARLHLYRAIEEHFERWLRE